MFTALLTTMDKYDEDRYTSGGIIDPTKTKAGLKEYQTVIAIGTSVRDIQVGDLVCVNPNRFAIKQHKQGSMMDGVIEDNPVTKYNFDVVEVDDKQYLLLQDRDIEFIVEDYEVVEDVEVKSKVEIIKPPKKHIIV